MKKKNHFNYLELVSGILFIASALTANLKLPFGLQGEYNPIASIILSIFCICFDKKLGYRRMLVAGFIVWPIIVALLLHIVKGGVDWMSVLKILIGPIFLISGGAVLRFVPINAYLFVLTIHFVYFLLALVDVGTAVSIAAMFNDRGSLYYQGWNAFFSSEPSYAAITLAMVGCLLLLKGTSQVGIVPILVCITLLISTSCLTGYFFATIFLIQSFRIGVLHHAGRFALLFVFAAIFTTVDSLGIFKANNRVDTIFNAIIVTMDGGAFESFILLEPSSGWRIMTNLAGFFSLIHFPIGTGSTKLQDIIMQVFPADLQNIWLQLLGIIEVSDVYYPQTVLANYLVFGGWPMAGGLLIIIGIAVNKFRVMRVRGLKIDFVGLSFIMSGVFWQSALTSPGWWWICGIFSIYLKGQSIGANFNRTDERFQLC